MFKWGPQEEALEDICYAASILYSSCSVLASKINSLGTRGDCYKPCSVSTALSWHLEALVLSYDHKWPGGQVT